MSYEYFGPENDTIATYEDKNVRVDFVNIGEGWSGDYNPNDTNDENLIRFDIFAFDIKTSTYKEISYDYTRCTCLPVNADPEIIQRAIKYVHQEVCATLNDKDASLGRTLDQLSWINANM